MTPNKTVPHGDKFFKTRKPVFPFTFWIANCTGWWIGWGSTHAYSHFCISHLYWRDWFSLLYIILFISRYCLFLLYTYFLFSLCVDMNDIPILCLVVCCITILLLCDACVVCLCGIHIYPLTSNSLVSGDRVPLDLVFDMRLVTLFAFRPS